MRDLAADSLATIVRPFDAAQPAATIALVGPDGNVLASAGREPPGPVAELASSAVRVAGRDVARVSVRGRPEQGGAALDALTQSLAVALGLLAEADGRSAELRDELERLHAASHQLEHARVDAELALGRRIQRSFVPLVAPQIAGWEIASHYEAAREVGGDFFDVFGLRGRAGTLAVVVADVTGKGIAAALLMAFARPLIHAAIDHARAPGLALERTNRILVTERRASLFITTLALLVDRRSGRYRLANAGHEPALLVGRDGAIRTLDAPGALLGAFADPGLEERDGILAPGELLLLYTDGITDARAAGGERFGEDRLRAVVADACRGSAAELVSAIAAASVEFQGEEPAADDVTLVALRRADRARRGRRYPIESVA